MEQTLRTLLHDAVIQAKDAGDLSFETLPEITLRRPPEKAHGDFASTLALELASQERRAPREVAQQIVKYLNIDHSPIQTYEIAGPGFINFFLNQTYWYDELQTILALQDRYGKLDIGEGKKVQVEFVSTNPTGPLHVGHGRGAVVGDVVASLLAFAGYDVQREYYVNDAGTQMDKLGHSTWCRYMELQGKDVPFIEEGYRGEYIYDIARDMIARDGERYVEMPFEEALPVFKTFACQRILQEIREDLERFNVVFDN
ncbi:arginine--tRNA ligase, partial [candidate division KSB3 bacterium]|nr:arginine--tRNA ligase [candidate division KSB3 bacterium]MBD3327444.1 arginine--tRNA ligase [candidate division KSB3 bacterium]